MIEAAAVQGQTKRATHYLHPAQWRVSNTPLEVTTILGTCVSVCLFDSKGLGGLNHYLLPKWVGTPPGVARYGDVAIELLVENLISLGAQKKDLRAKVFGGMQGAMRSEARDLGRDNATEAFRLLELHRIPVLAQDVVNNLAGRA